MNKIIIYKKNCDLLKVDQKSFKKNNSIKIKINNYELRAKKKLQLKSTMNWENSNNLVLFKNFFKSKISNKISTYSNIKEIKNENKFHLKKYILNKKEFSQLYNFNFGNNYLIKRRKTNNINFNIKKNTVIDNYIDNVNIDKSTKKFFKRKKKLLLNNKNYINNKKIKLSLKNEFIKKIKIKKKEDLKLKSNENFRNLKNKIQNKIRFKKNKMLDYNNENKNKIEALINEGKQILDKIKV